MDASEKQEFAQLIAAATLQALREASPSDSTSHEAEHIWLRERIQKERARAEFYRKVSQAVFGTTIAAALIWLGAKGLEFVQWLLRNSA